MTVITVTKLTKSLYIIGRTVWCNMTDVIAFYCGCVLIRIPDCCISVHVLETVMW